MLVVPVLWAIAGAARAAASANAVISRIIITILRCRCVDLSLHASLAAPESVLRTWAAIDARSIRRQTGQSRSQRCAVGKAAKRAILPANRRVAPATWELLSAVTTAVSQESKVPPAPTNRGANCQPGGEMFAEPGTSGTAAVVRGSVRGIRHSTYEPDRQSRERRIVSALALIPCPSSARRPRGRGRLSGTIGAVAIRCRPIIGGVTEQAPVVAIDCCPSRQTAVEPGTGSGCA